MRRTTLYLLLIILLALFLRCQGLFNPLLDEHSWRQTDTAAVAYNYYLNFASKIIRTEGNNGLTT
jgi:hypothetical protein